MSIEQKISELLEQSKKLQEDQLLESEELQEEEIQEFELIQSLNLQDCTNEELEQFIVSEEFSKLDELSQSTIKSYMNKAYDSQQDAKKKAAAHKTLGDKEGEEKQKAVAAKRKEGLQKAFNRDLAQRGYDPKKSLVKKAQRNIPDSYHKEETEYAVDVSEDVEALVNGENLSEEFKTKATTIFEAAVVTRVKQELAKLEEQFDAKLQEEVETIKEGLVEKVDGYLNYVVESWIEQNEIALESGIKTEIVESFITGMKGLFEQHYIDVPEEKYDVLGDMEKTVKSLEEKLNESMESSVALKKEINEMKRVAIIKSASDGMVDTDVEKFQALAEELSFEDSDTFSTKLKTIRENYFGKKTTSTVASVVSDEPVTLNEEADYSAPMKAYLKQLNSIK